MRVNSNIYNHMNTGVVPKKRNTTHKSSELKEIYNSMVRYNKNSPLYLLALSDAGQEHIISIKEAALTLHDTSDAFSDPDSAMYSRKMLSSDNEASITGSFRTQNSGSLPDGLSIRLDALASEQVNTGNYLEDNKLDLTPGTHNFVLETVNASTRFSVSVASDDTNLSVQNKLTQYINNRNLGVTASVISSDGSSAVMLSSNETGIPRTDDGLHFSVKDSGDNEDIVTVLGLNQITDHPANSEFYINNERHSSTSNHISINQTVELDFHAVSSEPVNIRFLPDTDTVIQQIDMFIDAYNNLVDMADAEGETSIGSRSLAHDISGIIASHEQELSSAGLSINESHHLVKDESVLAGSISDGSFADLFSRTALLKKDIDNATRRMTLDPMAYVNKLMVTYPNSRNQFGAAYTQSLYSGLMYNNYA